MRDELELLRRRLIDRAFAYDDPRSFEAGVQETFAALCAVVGELRAEQPAEDEARTA